MTMGFKSIYTVCKFIKYEKHTTSIVLWVCYYSKIKFIKRFKTKVPLPTFA